MLLANSLANNQRIMESEITTMLGQLLIVNSVYKETQWYDDNAANDVARAIHYRLQIIAITRGHMAPQSYVCVSQGI